MPIYAKSGEYTLVPEGDLAAVVVDVIDLGMEESYGSEKHMVRIVWQLSITQENGKRHLISRKYNLSTHKDSSLRADVEGMLGRKWSRDETQQFDVESLLGMNCVLTVEHNKFNGKLYANVMGTAPPPAAAPPLQPYNYIRQCHREEGVRSAPRGERTGMGYRGSQKTGTRPDGVPPVPSSEATNNDERSDKPLRTQTRNIVVEHCGRLRSIKATCLGLLAAHSSLAPVKKGYAAKRWSITHLPSGRRVTDISPSKAKAVELLKALQGFNWRFHEAETVPRGTVIQVWALTRQIEQNDEEKEATMDRLTADYLRAGQNLANVVEDHLRHTVPGTAPVADLQEALRLYRREELHVLNWRAVEATTPKPMAKPPEKTTTIRPLPAEKVS